MILIAYDGSADARAAIERAAQLCPGDRATVLVVWEPFMDSMLRTGAGSVFAASGVNIQEVDEANERSARAVAAAGAEVARYRGLQAEPRTRPIGTSVADAILTEADAAGADAIVIGTRGRSGIKSALLGSVSHAVLQHSDLPVIVAPSAEVAATRRTHRPRVDEASAA